METTFSAKPEVYNISHCRQRRTEPWLQVTGTENLVNFGREFFESEQTDRQTNEQSSTNRQTYTHADRNTLQSKHICTAP